MLKTPLEKLPKILPWLAGIVLLLQVLSSAQVIGGIASRYGVAFGLERKYASMDVAEALRTTSKSTWWESNGYLQYGPLYFRMGWTLDKMDSRLARGSEWKWSENRERHYHEALLLVNLLSFVGLLYTISCMLTPHRVERLIGTSVLWTAFQFSDIWCWGILVAKPENFICMLTAIGTLWAWKFFESSGTSWRHLLITALFFGLAMGTKLSTLVFLAVLPLCFLPLIDRHASGLNKWPIHRRILPGICFLAIVFGVYVAVGWPQNVNFAWLKPYMKFMHTQNAAPSGTMPPMEWGRRLEEQIIPAALGVLALSLIWRESSLAKRSWWTTIRAAGFAFYPIYYICQKNIASPSEHYLMQFIASGLVMFAGVLGSFWPRREAATESAGFRNLMNLGLLGLCILLPLVTSHRWGPFTAEMLESRQLSKSRYDLVRSIQAEGKKVYVDPYVAFEPSVGKAFWTYRVNTGVLEEGGSDVLVLLPPYHGRYLEEPPNFYVQFFHKNSWQDTRDFYRIFHEQEAVTGPHGHDWKLEEKLGLKIWHRQ